MKSKLFIFLAWTQIVLSLSLVVVLIWGYVSYKNSTGKLIHSIAASIGAMSDVVIRTAETVEARTELLDQSGQMLVVTRKQIQDLQAMVKNNAALVPQMASVILKISQQVNNLGKSTASIGDVLVQTSVPSAIQMDGLRPYLVMSRPLAVRGEDFRSYAKNIVEFGTRLSAASDSVARDSNNVSTSFVASTEQALKVLVEVESTLARLKSNDLPKAVADLKTISENLRNITAQVDLLGNIGIILLIGGLIISAWFFLQSLNALAVARTLVFDRNRLMP